MRLEAVGRADDRRAKPDVGDTAADAAELCDAIAASGALEVARARALTIVAEAKAGLPQLPERQLVALEMVADGVVDRFS